MFVIMGIDAQCCSILLPSATLKNHAKHVHVFVHEIVMSKPRFESNRKPLSEYSAA